MKNQEEDLNWIMKIWRTAFLKMILLCIKGQQQDAINEYIEINRNDVSRNREPNRKPNMYNPRGLLTRLRGRRQLSLSHFYAQIRTAFWNKTFCYNLFNCS